MADKEPDKNNNIEGKNTGNHTIEDSFVIYDPDNPLYETLHLCKYLLELPDLQQEDDPKAD